MYDMRVKNRVSCTSETGRSSESTSELDPMRAVEVCRSVSALSVVLYIITLL